MSRPLVSCDFSIRSVRFSLSFVLSFFGPSLGSPFNAPQSLLRPLLTSRTALTAEISLGQRCFFLLVPSCSTEFSLMIVGLRAYSPARPLHPASLHVRVPRVESLPSALSPRSLTVPGWQFGYGCYHLPRREPFIPIETAPARHTSCANFSKLALRARCARFEFPRIFTLGSPLGFCFGSFSRLKVWLSD